MSATSENLVPPPWIRWAVTALSGLALATAIYLLIVSLNESAQPLGCGAGSGCSEVLTSRWSRIVGLPVSAPAAALYLAVIVCMLFIPRVNVIGQRWLWRSSLLLAFVLLFAAAWFVGLQVIYLRAVCPWCIAEHVLGATVAALLIIGWSQVRYASPDSALTRRTWSFAIGGAALLLALFIIGQVFGPRVSRQVARLEASGEDVDQGSGQARRIVLLDGQLDIVPSELPHLGSTDADHLIVILFDYCCPHCRKAHSYLLDALSDYPGQLGLVLLPMPLNSQCNPHWEKTQERFADSCELAKLALAVWKADASRFPAFDRWLFEPAQPRSAEAARRRAESLVGSEALGTSLTDPWIDEVIRQDVDAFANSPAETIPVLLSPGFSGVVGRPPSKEALYRILQEELQLSAGN